eukprot:TRINITY_DN8025_c0_g1_i2.p1 TRINITY_DN8025_c0_g1~~TRINITY_DN8025_c0_g1_i2.p1  ORF type:complete len:360 (-),score=79.77 TRINITY_DN8025_c0_g1_i2:289-1368(-)
MILLCATREGEYASCDIGTGETVENLKAIVEAELRIPIGEQRLFYHSTELLNGRTLASYEIPENTILCVERARQMVAPVPKPRPKGGAASSRGSMGVDFAQLGNLLAQAVGGGAGVPGVPGDEMLPPDLPSDPLDPEYQRKLAEHIHRKNLEENFESALEYNPEAFATVHMLYVDCEVNGRPLKAFVDSGAQMTVMSRRCAEECSVMRLADTRYQGEARGVGSAKILGRIHMAQLRIGGTFFLISITVLDQDDMDFLLGLDMLRRHQMCIDLRKNALCIGDIEAPFLAEKDIPSRIRGPPAASDEQPPQQQQQGGGGGGDQEEGKVRRLVEMGFDPQDARQALAACNGDENQAASLLFG